MSLIFATQLTAIATAVLAVFAIVTAWYARRAFLKQSQEVRAIERQVKDEQELTKQQAELLKVQSGQLELQRQQLDDQIQANARQAEVLKLEADELRESLAQRHREDEEQHRSQAGKVAAWFTRNPEGSFFGIDFVGMVKGSGALIRNASGLPVLDIRAFFHYVDEAQRGAQWQPVMRGGPVERIRVLPPHLMASSRCPTTYATPSAT